MAIITFLIVLIVLILVHELGHFLAAKYFGIRVDEFGLGFPPRIWGYTYGETIYSINWIPFGGFVKIFGETPDHESIAGADSMRSMVNKPKWQQVIVLAAGVTFNIIFAWLLISLGFMSGMPASVDAYPGVQVQNAHVTLSAISAKSPAAAAGLRPGDEVERLESGKDLLIALKVSDVQEFIAAHPAPITITYARVGVIATTSATPVAGIVAGKAALGVSLDLTGTVKLPIHRALYEGAKTTWYVLENTAVGLGGFFKDIFMLKAKLSQVTGPVGIVGLVGDASALGFIYLLSFAAFISLNLAVINLLPLPALDGGRILFIIIEKIKGSAIKPEIANLVNTIGFFALIALMLVVTFHDIWKLIF